MRQFLAIINGAKLATLANVLFYFLLQNLFGIEFIAPSQNPSTAVSPLHFTDVIIFSILFSAGAGLVFLLIANTVKKPRRTFAIISLIVLLASLFLPMRIPTPPIPISTKLSLVGMHILGAAVLVPLLIIIGLPQKSGD